jgi:hypothetical protein
MLQCTNTFEPTFNHKGTIMIERNFLNSVVDTQHNIIEGWKALVDMQAWYAQKAMDEFEKYTKYLRPVEKK